jgi:hypothetical protein
VNDTNDDWQPVIEINLPVTFSGCFPELANEKSCTMRFEEILRQGKRGRGEADCKKSAVLARQLSNAYRKRKRSPDPIQFPLMFAKAIE